MSPHITEIIYKLDCQDQLLAVTDFCLYPPQAQNKKSIGGLMNLNTEKIISLKPDFIFATQSYNDLSVKLKNYPFKIVLLPEKTISDIFSSIDSVAKYCGRLAEGKKLKQAIRDSLEFYSVAITDNKPSAMLVLGREAGSIRNISVSGPGAFLNEVWELAGGVNAFADMAVPFAQVNREDLLIRDPDLIIEFKGDTSWSEEKNLANKKEWKELNNLQAVRSGNIYIVNGYHYLIPGPSVHRLAREYSKILRQYLNEKNIIKR